MNIFKSFLRFFSKTENFKIINDHKVKYTGAMSVDRKDAIRANAKTIQNIIRPGNVNNKIKTP